MKVISFDTRLKVMKRDGHRCRWIFGGECEGGLTLAHILPRGQYPELIDEPDNIILLCLKHHEKSDQSKFKEWMRSLLPKSWQESGPKPTHEAKEIKIPFRKRRS